MPESPERERCLSYCTEEILQDLFKKRNEEAF